MGRFEDWLRKRKTKKESARSVINDYQNGDSFSADIEKIWKERRQEREIQDVECLKRKDVNISFRHLSTREISQHRDGYSIVPPRASRILNSMALYTASLQHVRQQPPDPKLQSSLYWEKRGDIFSKLSPDLTFYLMDGLDTFSILNLKVCNKRLYAVISLSHLPDTTLEYIKRRFYRQNNPLASTSSSKDTQSSSKPPINREEMGTFHEKRENRKRQARGLDVMICGSCCNFLFQVPGISLKDICRCENATFSPSDEYTTWSATHVSTNSTSLGNGNWENEMNDGSKNASYNSASWNFSKFQKPSEKIPPKSNGEQNAVGAKQSSSKDVADDFDNMWMCSICSRYKALTPNSETTEICLCKGTPLSSEKTPPSDLQQIPQNTTQERSQTIKLPMKRVSLIGHIERMHLVAEETTCTRCSIFTQDPMLIPKADLCKCPKAEAATTSTTSEKQDVKTCLKISNQVPSLSPQDPAQSMNLQECLQLYEKYQTSLQEQRTTQRTTCTRCSKSNQSWRPESERCQCADEASVPAATPSNSKIFRAFPKPARKVCSTCHLFSEKNPWPALNPAKEMCRCSTIHYQSQSVSTSAVPTITNPFPSVSICLFCQLGEEPTTIHHRTPTETYCRCFSSRIPATPLLAASSATSSTQATCPKCRANHSDSAGQIDFSIF